jgi:hypothetical protein
MKRIIAQQERLILHEDYLEVRDRSFLARVCRVEDFDNADSDDDPEI